MLFTVFRENLYASSVIEVEPDQQVVSTGPYSIVRHPLYLGAILMLLFTPLALGSCWALVPFLAIGAFVVLRLLNEERFLLEALKGYKDIANTLKQPATA